MEDMDHDHGVNRPTPSLAETIAAKRAEIEAAGHCQWGYRTIADIDREERRARLVRLTLILLALAFLLAYVAR